jgi:hypothetical protein
MTEEQANFINNAMCDEGCDCEIRDDYSGRGMGGNSCHAVVVDSFGDILPAIVNSMKEMTEEELKAVPNVGNFRTDNMGYSTVVY